MADSDVARGFAAIVGRKYKKKSTVSGFASVLEELNNAKQRIVNMQAKDTESKLSYHQAVVKQWHDEVRDLMKQFNMDTTGCPELDKVLSEGN